MPSWWPGGAEVEYVVDEDGGSKEEKASILDVEAHVLWASVGVLWQSRFGNYPGSKISSVVTQPITKEEPLKQPRRIHPWGKICFSSTTQ